MGNATLRSHFACSSRLAPRAFRPGVTLIELLVTIMIISILAAAVLGVAAVAGETAREAKTRTIISRIHTLLMQHYDTYTTRRVKLQPTVLNGINDPMLSATTAQRGRLKAEARLYAMRELMLMEMPDRWSDVLLNVVPNPPANGVALDPLYFEAPPAPDLPGNPANRTELGSLYLRTYRRIASANNKLTNNTNTTDQILANQGAECLYMVVMNACGDGEARTLFPASSIGDTDGDGAPEFLDGWGHPIEFLRWAPGFESDVQSSAQDMDNLPTPAERDSAWRVAGSADHDPFDLYRAQPNAFRLVPLVYSAGRDEESGLIDYPTFCTWRKPSPASVSFNLNFNVDAPRVLPTLNPYGKETPTNYYPDKYLGSATDRALATDNIHNHLIGTR